MNTSRRKFIKNTVLVGAGMHLTWPEAMGHVYKNSNITNNEPMTGIQIAPYSILDEGMENCLDLLKDEAAVNALFCYSQTYHMGYDRPVNVKMDHGFGVWDERKRNLPRKWFNSHDEFYKNTILGHETRTPDMEYYKADLFHEIMKPAKERGIKIYARILEASANRKDLIPNYEKVLTIDIDGNPGRGPCWNHPDYREWIRATIEDMVTHYELDGLQYGAERTGPISYLLFSGKIPTCFCEYCRKRNEEKNIDFGRAKEGYVRLYKLIKEVEAGKQPVDGVMATVYRYFQQYPEVLAWNYQWFQADNEIHDMIYKTAKRIRPEMEVGRHVDHQRSSWDIWYRAAVPYSDMTSSSDFIKPILYHDILGLRLRWWVIEQWHKYVYSDMSRETILDMFYENFNLDPDKMPDLEGLNNQGLGPEYVFTETKRCVDGVDGKAKVYAGLGIDVPWHLPEGGMEPVLSEPETTIKAVHRAFDAGTDGILISREYDEMSLDSLRAVGKAIRDRS